MVTTQLIVQLMYSFSCVFFSNKVTLFLPTPGDKLMLSLVN